MTEPTTPASVAGPVPYRTATIATLVAASILLVFFFVGNRVVPGADFTGEDRTTLIYLMILALSIACFVVSLVLRSRTKRLGLPRGLANAAVAISSVLFGIVAISALLLIGAFLLLVLTFAGG